MEDQKYLIALALAEQNKKRIMPIGGKTIPMNASLNDLLKKDAEKIAQGMPSEDAKIDHLFFKRTKQIKKIKQIKNKLKKRYPKDTLKRGS